MWISVISVTGLFPCVPGFLMAESTNVSLRGLAHPGKYTFLFWLYNAFIRLYEAEKVTKLKSSLALSLF